MRLNDNWYVICLLYSFFVMCTVISTQNATTAKATTTTTIVGVRSYFINKSEYSWRVLFVDLEARVRAQE